MFNYQRLVIGFSLLFPVCKAAACQDAASMGTGKISDGIYIFTISDTIEHTVVYFVLERHHKQALFSGLRKIEHDSGTVS